TRRLALGSTTLALFLAAVGMLQPDLPAWAQRAGPSDRIFAATSFGGGVGTIYEITGGERVPFARLNHGGWVGPLAVRGDGRLFAVTNANRGSLYDITDGGDLTTAKPLARALFPTGNGYVYGLAFDDAGNAYVGMGETGRPQPIAVVTPDGSVDYLPL